MSDTNLSVLQWKDYRDLPNTENNMLLKAQILGAAITSIIPDNRAYLEELVCQELDDVDKQEIKNKFKTEFHVLTRDFLFFYLQLVSRDVKQYFSLEEFHLFMDALYVDVRERIVKANFNKVQAHFFRKKFNEQYNLFQRKYHYYKVEDSIGFVSPNTLFGEFISDLETTLGIKSVFVLVGLPQLISNYLVALNLGVLITGKKK